jgi:catechol 2,3-dioxygenase
VELYWDKPREEWPFDSQGKLQMITARLDVQALLAEAGQ